MRAVDEGQPFLGLQGDGGKAFLREGLNPGPHLPVNPGLSFPDQNQTRMGQRGEIAGGSDRSP